MINTPCPNCHAPTMPAPKKRGRNVYVTCPICGRSVRAKFTDTVDGAVIVEYSAPSAGRGLSQMVSFRETPDYAAKIAAMGDEWIRQTLRSAL